MRHRVPRYLPAVVICLPRCRISWNSAGISGCMPAIFLVTPHHTVAYGCREISPVSSSLAYRSAHRSEWLAMREMSLESGELYRFYSRPSCDTPQTTDSHRKSHTLYAPTRILRGR